MSFVLQPFLYYLRQQDFMGCLNMRTGKEDRAWNVWRQNISLIYGKSFIYSCWMVAICTDFFEIGNMTGRMKEKLDENLNQKNFGWQFPDMNLFQMETSHIYEPKYLLVTDADGEVLLDMISAYMKKNLPREAAEENSSEIY